MLVSLKEQKVYSRIDFDEEDNLIESFIIQAEIYINKTVGTKWEEDEEGLELGKLLIMKLVDDLYNNREYKLEKEAKTDIIVNTILDTLSLYEEE